jgi:hypothetical protein
VRVTLSDRGSSVLRPRTSWQSARLNLRDGRQFEVDPNYYVVARDLSEAR